MNSKDITIKMGLALCFTVFVGIVQPAGAAESQAPGPPSGVTQTGRTVVLDDIVFGFNEASPTPDAIELLEWLALYLVKNPEKKVIISGHTDVSGPDAYNTFLSKQRAHAVSKVLTDAGIERGRILLRWFGEEKPLDDNAKLSSRVESRRVEIEVQ